jgi:predicted nucleic acid-binding protein
MSVLLDTNILTRLAQQAHPHHSASQAAITTLANQGELLHIVPQNLYEFWTVATRPIGASNGLGLTIVQAKAEMARIQTLFVMLFDTPAVFTEWERLVETYEVRGKTAHDARLMAALNVHGLTQIRSFNDRDFSRFAPVKVINPLAIAAQPKP